MTPTTPPLSPDPAALPVADEEGASPAPQTPTAPPLDPAALSDALRLRRLLTLHRAIRSPYPR